MNIPQRRRWLYSSRDFTFKPSISSLLLSQILLLLVFYGSKKEVSKPEHTTSNTISTIERDKKWSTQTQDMYDIFRHFYAQPSDGFNWE
jgi:hypothetical protein